MPCTRHDPHNSILNKKNKYILSNLSYRSWGATPHDPHNCLLNKKNKFQRQQPILSSIPCTRDAPHNYLLNKKNKSCSAVYPIDHGWIQP